MSDRGVCRAAPGFAKKGLLCCFGPVLVFSSNLSNWECHLSIVPKMGTSDIHVQSAQNLKISKTNPKKIFFPSFF